MKKKLRPVGYTLLDLETVLEEMVDNHDLQMGDILSLVHGWLSVHRPDCKEVYLDDNTNPIFYYGPEKKG